MIAITKKLTSKLGKLVTCLSMAVLLSLAPFKVKAEVLDTAFFSVDLGKDWKIAGQSHNFEHSLNINLHNAKHRVSINIVVGSGKITPYKLLTDLQKSLRAQRAKVNGIQQRGGDALYFDFRLGQMPGLAAAATNGRDVSCITILGNKQVAMNFIRTFDSHDPILFPTL